MTSLNSIVSQLKELERLIWLNKFPPHDLAPEIEQLISEIKQEIEAYHGMVKDLGYVEMASLSGWAVGL